MKLVSFLRLARPANILTAIADILLGFAASGLVSNSYASFDFSIENFQSLTFLIISTIGLYGGGIVFNDVFDAELDLRERPERMIPSGKVSKKSAIIFGVTLYLVAIISATQVSTISLVLTFIIIGLSLFYDAIGKGLFIGSLTMGLTRATNLILGMSATYIFLFDVWYPTIISLLYISTITWISRYEVVGGRSYRLISGLFVYILVSLVVQLFSLDMHSGFQNFLATMPFVIGFMIFAIIPLMKAINDPAARKIQKAVGTGVLSLILLDASMAVQFAGWGYALMIVLLLPVSIFLSRRFAVT